MNRFLSVAIGFALIALPLTNLLPGSVFAQTPEAEPAPSPEPDSEAPALTVPEGYQAVTGEGWSFAVPADWQTVLSSPVEVQEGVTIVAQLNDSQKQAIVNLVIQPYDGDNNDYIDESIDALSDLGTVHTQEPLDLAGLPGVDVEVSLDSTEPATHLLQRLVAANGIGFALTCGGPEENFAATQPVCQTILNSFQLTSP